ncbi:MAG: methylglyoxal synthase [Oscillospiraceae bacterium]|jgi:methylglyoxal synthase|nr:methylglyoxal synthase [Oscillospiraceae bacterium]
MNIALLAHDNKKELMVQFCSAYKGILEQHSLTATNQTGMLLRRETGLKISTVLSGHQGGLHQIASRIAYNEFDMVLFFCDSTHPEYVSDLSIIIPPCDLHSIPFASNAGTAEVLIHGLRRGALDWRELVRK